jgi:predicted nucleic acid-binding protein
LAEYAQTVRLITETDICRDKKDNFLLSLAFDADADYLVTGDNDLLVLLEIKNAKIVTFRFFEQIMMNYI